jgi:diguanylate cyclase (GGDEF)-like protein
MTSPNEQRLVVERTRMLYRQAQPAIVISVAIALLLAAVLKGHADSRRLGAWVAVVTTLAVGRGVLAWAYRRREVGDDAAPRWSRWFVVTHLVVAAAWGIGGLALMPPDSRLHQAIVYFFLMGLASGAAATYAAHVRLVVGSITLVMAPATIAFALQPSFELRAMAIGGVVYVLATYRATRLLGFFLRRSFQLSYDLQLAHDEAQRLARTDALTGLSNRRALFETAESVFAGTRRYNRPVSLVVIDLDHFKAINDRRGHAAGDEALRLVARVIGSTIRASDIAGRIGGEEFAIVLPETTAADAANLAERLRERIASHPAAHNGDAFALTASFGVAGDSGGGVRFESLLARADAALYDAKAEGRNRVVTVK